MSRIDKSIETERIGIEIVRLLRAGGVLGGDC